MKTFALLYHDIVPELRHELSGFQGPDANIYKLDCEEFQRHLHAMAKYAPAVPTRVDAGSASCGMRRVLLTFDDGGSSTASYVAKMLSDFGWPAHFFIATDYIGQREFLNSAQIRDLAAANHIIGSHSCSHPERMSYCSKDDLEREWRDSTARLREILGHPVVTASVPGGFYSDAVAAAAAKAGIRFLFTSEPVTSTKQVDGCQVIGRFCVQQGVSAEWVGSLLSGRLRPRLESYAYWKSKAILKRIFGRVWLSARKSIFSWRATQAKKLR